MGQCGDEVQIDSSNDFLDYCFIVQVGKCDLGSILFHNLLNRMTCQYLIIIMSDNKRK